MPFHNVFRPGIYAVSSVVVALTLFSCAKADPDVEIPEEFVRTDLIGWHLNGSIKLEKIKETCTSAGIPDSLLKYDVDCYKLEYVTDYMGENVRAEALMMIPRGVPETKYAVYCHGTNMPLGTNMGTKVFYEYAGPGTGHDYDEIRKCVLPLASHGYCTICPEYTGYGSTAKRQHPFVYCPELCKSVIDGIFAGRDFLNDMDVTLDKDLYLTGWSQGGSACLATEKYLEEDFPDEFNIVATSCLSGPFNLIHFVSELFTQPDKMFLAIGLQTWAAYAINYFAENMRRPIDQIFLLPVYDQTYALLVDGASAAEVFRPMFIRGVLTGHDTGFCNALSNSSYHEGWAPKSHVYLHHGTEDSIVPFYNSQDAYDGLSKESGTRVELRPAEGFGHFNYVDRYMVSTINDFRVNDGGL